MRKIDFPYNNFPKKDISLRKCTKKTTTAFDEKKVNKNLRLRHDTVGTPPGMTEFLRI